ncbi:MAG: hypothetical protein WA019_03870 [Candidatus Moraniibacteriota bacterium]
MFNLESGLMRSKKETESKSVDEKNVQRAEYFADRIINNEPSDPTALEHETQYLKMHVQDLLDILAKPQSENDSELRDNAERIILKIFKNAEYKDEIQLDSPPAYRKYADQYGGVMKKIYSFLALQTLASSGRTIKDYNHLSHYDSKEGGMGPAVISALEKRDKGEATKYQIQASNKLLIKILEEYSLPPEDTISAWKSSGYTNSGDEIALGAMQNVEAMRYLESVYPGSAGVLSKQFGIRHFGRYPEKLLAEQYQERDNCDKPYGVMFSAISDHNGVFRTAWGDTKFLWENLKGKYSFRIFEVGRKFGIGRRLVECNVKYGERHKISFAKFNGHGEKNKIIFGRNDENVFNVLTRTLFRKSEPTSISSRDLEGGGFKRAKKFFIESPHLIFEACGAGVENGIVQKASKIYETETLGQDYVGSSLPIHPVLDNEGVISSFATYSKEWEKLAGRYRKGERI